MPDKSCELFIDRTLYVIGGSTEVLRFRVLSPVTKEPVELRNAKSIEWLLTTYSVKSRYAVLTKSLARNEISILENPVTKIGNILQITINNEDTKDLQGAFIHQTVITDSRDMRFVPFQGLLVIGKGIKS